MTTLKARAASVLVSPRLARMRRRVADKLAAARSEKPTLTLYYQAGDAYSHLCAQLLPTLRDRLKLQVKVVVIPFINDETNAAPNLSPAYGLIDATRIAPAWGLDISAEAQAPEYNVRDLAARVLLTAKNLDDFLSLEAAVAKACWQNDASTLNTFALMDPAPAREQLEDNHAELRDRGHYQGGMWHFRGDWYWALDRLNYLEARLRDLDLVTGDTPLAQLRPERAYLPPLAKPEKLDLFYSFRSPYSYLVIERIIKLTEAHGVTLNIRPVLPMVMRGFKVPRSKRMYIVRDAKREADRLAIPFGKIADPIGGGVERCLAAFPEVEKQGKAAEFLVQAGRATWSQGEDISRTGVLRNVLERAGIDPMLAESAPAHGVDLSYAEHNREALFEQGLWGVPSFLLGDMAVWGQDRLWLLEEVFRRAQN